MASPSLPLYGVSVAQSPELNLKKAMSKNSSQNKEFDAKTTRDDAGRDDKRRLTPEAQRALAEAKARRAQKSENAAAKTTQKEVGGRKGPDPVRFGDWEKGGLVSDF